MDDEIFIVKARRCKRCGGLLTSAQAVKDGYGHVCKMKTFAHAEPRHDPNQTSLFDEDNNNNNEGEDQNGISVTEPDCEHRQL